MTMKLLLLLSFALCTMHNLAHAQGYQNPYDSYTPGSYNNYIREKNNAARDAERVKSTPNTPGPASTTKYRFEEAREKREREEQRAIDAEARQAAKDAEDKKIQAEKDAKWDKEYAAELAAKANGLPFQIQKTIESYGYFKSWEVSRLVSKATSKEGKLTPEADQILRVPIYYREYLAIASTGTFEEVQTAIEKFNILTTKAMEAIKGLEKRFPLKQKELAIASIQTLRNGSISDLPLSWSIPFGRYIIEYPEEFFRYFKLDSSLYECYRDIMYGYKINYKKQPEKVLKIQKAFLDFASMDVLVAQRYDNAAEYLDQLTEEEMWQLALRRGVAPAFLALYHSYGSYESFFMVSKLPKSIYFNRKDYLNKPTEDRIKAFAYRGDPYAGAVYGVRVLEGFTKEKRDAALPWFQKAVEAKTPHAEANMATLCSYEVKAWKGTVCK